MATLLLQYDEEWGEGGGPRESFRDTTVRSKAVLRSSPCKSLELVPDYSLGSMPFLFTSGQELVTLTPCIPFLIHYF